MTTTIAITPDTTLDDIRAALPLGGDYGLVHEGDEWLLWIEVAPAGLATLNDERTAIDVSPDENLYAIAEKWLADVS